MNESVLNTNKLPFLEFLHQIEALPIEQLYKIQEKNLSKQELERYLIQDKILTPNYLHLINKSYNKIPFISLLDQELDYPFAQQLTESLARHYTAFLYDQTKSNFRVCMKNPLDDQAIEEISSHLQTFVMPILANAHDIDRIINLCYRKEKKINTYAQRLAYKIESYKNSLQLPSKHPELEHEHVGLRLLKAILFDAVQMQASDVHLELDNNQLKIRLRIDGYLQEHIIPNRDIGLQLFRILKAQANLDISITNIAQDGKISMPLDHALTVNARISIVPIDRGSSAVIRLMGQENQFDTLRNIIPDSKIHQLTEQFLTRKQGMLLITGPTGCGKTTTLYTALKEINNTNKKIITIEAPVELYIPGINQIEINPESDFDFAQALKSSLRQDPDVILVGEIRDEKTANIGVRTAITGHLVLSTLHTNDTISTIIRLINLEVPGYLIAASVDIILAQRLLRKICPRCKIKDTLSANDQTILSKIIKQSPSKITFHQGKGCKYCNNTGYFSRCAVFECLELTAELKDLLALNKIEPFKNLAKKQLENTLLINQAFALVQLGTTTVEELFSIM